MWHRKEPTPLVTLKMTSKEASLDDQLEKEILEQQQMLSIQIGLVVNTSLILLTIMFVDRLNAG
ncbi:hypothetical protein [Olivibacter ginsenosidimutans]